MRIKDTIGFTLVELLIALMIMGIMAAIAGGAKEKWMLEQVCGGVILITMRFAVLQAETRVASAGPKTLPMTNDRLSADDKFPPYPQNTLKAGGGDRTRVTSLEGWCPATGRHPRCVD